MTAPNISKLYKRLAEYNSDPESLLAKLEAIYTQTYEGYETEKPTARGIVVKVWERDPRTALKCVQVQAELMKFFLKHSEDDNPKTQITLLPSLEEL